IQDLNDKYANTPGAQTIPLRGQAPLTLSVDPSVMTPEDAAAYQQARFAIGGTSTPVEGNAPRPGEVRAAPPRPVAGRQRLPNYDPNTPEGRFEAVARPLRESSPDGLLHLDLNTLPENVLPLDRNTP